MLRRVCLVASLLLFSTQAFAQLYATTGGGGSGCCSLYAVDPTSGAATLIGTPNFGAPGTVLNLGMPGIDFTSTGRLMAVTGGTQDLWPSLVELDPATGALVSYIGELDSRGDDHDIRDIAIQPGTDTIFAVSYDGDLYTIDSTTADVTVIGGSIIDGPIAFGADGTLYMAQMNCTQGSPAALYTVDTATGDATLVALLDNFYIGLGMGPDGMLYGTDFAGNEQWQSCGGTWGDVYRIDPGTGNETFLGSNTGRIIHDLASPKQPARLPVPGLTGWGAALLALGLAAVGLRRLLG